MPKKKRIETRDQIHDLRDRLIKVESTIQVIKANLGTVDAYREDHAEQQVADSERLASLEKFVALPTWKLLVNVLRSVKVDIEKGVKGDDPYSNGLLAAANLVGLKADHIERNHP